jgi:hypothetical protein
MSPEEKRLQAMVDDDHETWDLSENDTAAISWVLGALKHRTGQLESLSVAADQLAQAAEQLNKVVSNVLTWRDDIRAEELKEEMVAELVQSRAAAAAYRKAREGILSD